jgi:hypothetical protein
MQPAYTSTRALQTLVLALTLLNPALCVCVFRYNIIPDLPSPPPPPLHPKTLQPITGEDLAPLFPMGLIQQEVSNER